MKPEPSLQKLEKESERERETLHFLSMSKAAIFVWFSINLCSSNCMQCTAARPLIARDRVSCERGVFFPFQHFHIRFPIREGRAFNLSSYKSIHPSYFISNFKSLLQPVDVWLLLCSAPATIGQQKLLLLSHLLRWELDCVLFLCILMRKIKLQQIIITNFNDRLCCCFLFFGV